MTRPIGYPPDVPAEVGSQAPDFTLRNEDGQEVTLSSMRGQNVVLVFYPFAFSSLCTKELHDITGLEDRFGASGAEVFGISVDSPFAQKAFRNAEGIQAHLLSDFEPKGAVAREYDMYIEKNGTNARGFVVIDAEGKVKHVHKSPSPLEIPAPNLIFEALGA